MPRYEGNYSHPSPAFTPDIIYGAEQPKKIVVFDFANPMVQRNFL